MQICALRWARQACQQSPLVIKRGCERERSAGQMRRPLQLSPVHGSKQSHKHTEVATDLSP
eukprot:5870929-Alexandrium_andersonii.AAC.1